MTNCAGQRWSAPASAPGVDESAGNRPDRQSTGRNSRSRWVPAPTDFKMVREDPHGSLLGEMPQVEVSNQDRRFRLEIRMTQNEVEQ
jgi:hypothetical protein